MTLGCYDPTEGCLDILAKNYSPSAYEPCDDCCTYPSIALRVSHLSDTSDFSIQDTLIDIQGDSAKIIEQKLFISDISITKSNGQSIASRDFIDVNISGQNLMEIDDIRLLRRTQSSLTFYSYRDTGTVANVSFTVGLDDFYDPIDLVAAEEIDPLDFSEGMRDNGTYVTGRIDLARGKDLTDTISILIKEDLLFQKQITGAIAKGSDIIIPLAIDYMIWYEGVLFGSDSADSIAAKLTRNATKAIK